MELLDLMYNKFMLLTKSLIFRSIISKKETSQLRDGRYNVPDKCLPIPPGTFLLSFEIWNKHDCKTHRNKWLILLLLIHLFINALAVYRVLLV